MPDLNNNAISSANESREVWLLGAVDALSREVFSPLGYSVPKVRVSVGYASGGLRSAAVGQCWSRRSASDEFNHIFISPALGSAYEVIDTLAHELIHAVDDCKNKHGKEFKKIALAIGMTGPMRSAGAGPSLKSRLEGILKVLPTYPSGSILRAHHKSVTTPTPQAVCHQCGYRVTVPRRFVHIGPPICPTDKQLMTEVGEWPS